MSANRKSTPRSSRPKGGYPKARRGRVQGVREQAAPAFVPEPVRQVSLERVIVVDPDRRPLTDLAALDAHSPEPDDEAPEFTLEQIKHGRLHVGGVPAKRGRPPKAVTKQKVNLRLSPEVIAHFRKSGAGWQTRIDEALLRIAKRGR